MGKTKDLLLLYRNIRTLVVKYDLLEDYTADQFTRDLFELVLEELKQD
jgi:hypothetical protein